MDWFLYDKGLRHERVEFIKIAPNSKHTAGRKHTENTGRGSSSFPKEQM